MVLFGKIWIEVTVRNWTEVKVRKRSNFTKFELANFLVLKGKYSKTLFRLLTQYKNMGKAYNKPVNSISFDWKMFKDLMGIPKSSIYTTARIEKQILVPAIGEISWTQIDTLTNYNGVEFPYFINLQYKKIQKDPTKKTLLWWRSSLPGNATICC